MEELKISIIGLGYVGLPLAIAFAKKFNTVGYDIDEQRIKDLSTGFDYTGEVDNEDIVNSSLKFTSLSDDISDSNIFIITVPTPIDNAKRPDTSLVISATTLVGSFLKKKDIVIYESTVYPGMTEEECAPLLERESGLVFNQDFFCGYSPERINPGDKEKGIYDIVKVTSGSDKKTAIKVNNLYSEIIDAGTYLTSSIKIAEAAKVIENTQRDINIALMNELALIFNKLGIDTQEVLSAAGTKWNFLNFTPGLVGGHCISVDPYYLTYKSRQIGYEPLIISAGRKINDSMSIEITNRLVKELINNKLDIIGAKILLMGITFKENCPDSRNSKVVDVYKELIEFKCSVDVYDPIAISRDVKSEFGINLISSIKERHYDAIVVAVAHNNFKEMGLEKIKSFGKKSCVFFDVKAIFPNHSNHLRL